MYKCKNNTNSERDTTDSERNSEQKHDKPAKVIMMAVPPAKANNDVTPNSTTQTHRALTKVSDTIVDDYDERTREPC